MITYQQTQTAVAGQRNGGQAQDYSLAIRTQNTTFERMVQAFVWKYLWTTIPLETLERIAQARRRAESDFRSARAFVEQARPQRRWVELPAGSVVQVVNGRRLVGETMVVLESFGYLLQCQWHNPRTDREVEIGINLLDSPARILSLAEHLPAGARTGLGTQSAQEVE